MKEDIITLVTFLPVVIPFILYALPFKKKGWRRHLFRYLVIGAFALGGAYFYYYVFKNTGLMLGAVAGRALVYYTILEVVRRFLPGVRRARRKAKRKTKIRRVLFSILALALVVVIARDFLLDFGLPFAAIPTLLP